MELVKKRNGKPLRIFTWACPKCYSLVRALENDIEIKWDTRIGWEYHMGSFHFQCPGCNCKSITSTTFDGFDIQTGGDE